jgi:hypothetical protein
VTARGTTRRDRTVNDAERLRHDPVMRWIVGGKAAHGCAASPSQLGRFETQWLAAGNNLSALADLSGQWVDLVHARRPPRGIVLDMDSSVSPTHGEQEMSAWNGHYACTCYHPLFVFNQFGDLAARSCAGARRPQNGLSISTEKCRLPFSRRDMRQLLRALISTLRKEILSLSRRICSKTGCLISPIPMLSDFMMK